MINEEIEPSDEFINGFNHAYLLSFHSPELAISKLVPDLSSLDKSDYGRGLLAGAREYEREIKAARTTAEAEEWADKLKFGHRDKPNLDHEY